MIQKHLILVDEQSQSAVLQNIKATLKNDGIELVFKEFNPINYRKPPIKYPYKKESL